MEKRCDVTEFGRPVDEPSSTVLNFLKLLKVFWGTRKKSIAVV